ncbi:hypothetical protein J1N35_026653 [Gossypium stocksii]|uniref:Uncharacterized protein n=1 Tax=Gossypium stocksii TaxID=47602 RepID=A0A9D3ZXA8_9ROSI|nr:hypothetical protein J1N35_026647 [Gossypium stocksii]KAH1074325.1 hypothetical protein J1N35_026653 [Gossypium stocksii]
MMKKSHERGKAVEVYNNIDTFHDYNRTSSNVPCKEHPQLSSAGVCAYCLRDRLINLVCSDCGVQRFSSCSCAGRGGEAAGIGRVSFLIENENKEQVPNAKPRRSTSAGNKSEEIFLIKRSDSGCAEIKKKNGFWGIGRLFGKKRDKYCNNCGKSEGGVDEKSDLLVVDCTGVSRSRSLCSFRGGAFFGSEDRGDLTKFSGARSSISAARSSGFNGGLGFDGERKSGLGELGGPRKSGSDSAADIKATRKAGCGGFMEVDGGANRRVQRYFNGGDDDSGFIDLKFGFQAETKGALSAFGSMRNGCSIKNASSCQITVDEREIKQSRKSFKGWRWIFKSPEK